MDSDWVVDETRVYLIHPLRRYFKDQGVDAYVSGDSFVYYDPDVPPVGPDFYVVKGGCQRGQTKWVVWEENWSMPTTVVEFLSRSTETRDRGEKFCIYRDALEVENYVLVDQESLQIEAYQLTRGHYVTVNPAVDGWYELSSLGLQIGIEGEWVRLRTPLGQLLQTSDELAEAEGRRADLMAEENRRLLQELERLRSS